MPAQRTTPRRHSPRSSTYAATRAQLKSDLHRLRKLRESLLRCGLCGDIVVLGRSCSLTEEKREKGLCAGCSRDVVERRLREDDACDSIVGDMAFVSLSDGKDAGTDFDVAGWIDVRERKTRMVLDWLEVNYPVADCEFGSEGSTAADSAVGLEEDVRMYGDVGFEGEKMDLDEGQGMEGERRFDDIEIIL